MNTCVKMATEDLQLESKCEELMNKVVVLRQRFGKTCVEYDKKILQMENKLLNLQVETSSNYRAKSKIRTPNVDEEANTEMDDFILEVMAKQKRIEDLKAKLKNTTAIIFQLNNDNIGKKLRAPLVAEAMLAQAKAKNI